MMYASHRINAIHENIKIKNNIKKTSLINIIINMVGGIMDYIL